MDRTQTPRVNGQAENLDPRHLREVAAHAFRAPLGHVRVAVEVDTDNRRELTLTIADPFSREAVEEAVEAVAPEPKSSAWFLFVPNRDLQHLSPITKGDGVYYGRAGQLWTVADAYKHPDVAGTTFKLAPAQPHDFSPLARLVELPLPR